MNKKTPKNDKKTLQNCNNDLRFVKIWYIIKPTKEKLRRILKKMQTAVREDEQLPLLKSFIEKIENLREKKVSPHKRRHNKIEISVYKNGKITKVPVEHVEIVNRKSLMYRIDSKKFLMKLDEANGNSEKTK